MPDKSYVRSKKGIAYPFRGMHTLFMSNGKCGRSEEIKPEYAIVTIVGRVLRSGVTLEEAHKLARTKYDYMTTIILDASGNRVR